MLSLAPCQEAQSDVKISVLTIEEAESIAVARNLDVLTARAQSDIAAATYLSSRTNFLPTAYSSASWRRYDREVLSFRNDQFLYSKNRYSLGLSVSFPLFSGGVDYISLRRAKLARDVAWLSYLDRREQAAAEAVSAYLALVQAIMEERISEQSLERALDEQEMVNKRYSLGLASDVDVSKMSVQVAQRKLAMIQAQNNVQRRQEELCVLLNFPLDTTFDVDTSMTPPDEERIPPLEHFLEKSRNRSVLSAEIDRRSAELGKLASWLSYIPKLSLSADWSWSDAQIPDKLSALRDDGSFSYGISLSWTLFSGTSRIADIRGSSAQLSQTIVAERKTKQSVEQQIRESYRSMVEAAAGYALSDAQMRDANLALSATRKRYELGSATILELLDAEISLEQAQLQRLSAMLNYYRAEAQLRWLCGDDGN